MTSIVRAAFILLLAALAGLGGFAPAGAVDASGVVTGQITDRPDLGNYRYEIRVSWGPLSHGLSHLDVVLSGLYCPCLCERGVVHVAFADAAGSSQSPGNGAQGTCSVAYSGQLACNGDPSIGVTSPLIKWQPTAGQTCQPGKAGSGVFVFYSNWPPGAEQVIADAIRIKEGQLLVYGDVRGNMPNCQCATSGTEASTWGGVKSIYR